MFDQQVFCSFSPHSLASGFDFVLPFFLKKVKTGNYIGVIVSFK